VGRFLNADGIIGANGGIMGYNMFAYCNNNPVMYSDPSGNSWLPFEKLRYQGEIHRAVLEHLEKTRGYQIEQTIPGTRLRIDAIDGNGDIYEVKPCTWRSGLKRGFATAQLLNYANKSGREYGKEQFNVTFPYENFIVQYWTEDSLVFYNFYEKEAKKKEKVSSSSSFHVEITLPSLDPSTAFALSGLAMAGGKILIHILLGGPFETTVDNM
jgi:hypothetical protein